MVTLRPRFSSNRPREAQIIPFPSEDVTPPVTNTYLVCTGPEVYWGEPGTSWTAQFIREDDSAPKMGHAVSKEVPDQNTTFTDDVPPQLAPFQYRFLVKCLKRSKSGH